MLRTSPEAGRSAGGCPVVPPCAAAGVPGLPRLRRASRRAARRCSSGGSGGGLRRSAPGASGRSRSQTQAPGGQGWRRAGSAHGTIIARTGVPAPLRSSPSRARFSASAQLPCSTAEDGVGDLHPLGIGIVAVVGITRSPGAERHVGAEAVGGTGLVRQALALQRLWREQRRSCAVAAPSASSCQPAGASGDRPVVGFPARAWVMSPL